MRYEATVSHLTQTRSMLISCATETMNQYNAHGADLQELSEALDVYRRAMGKFAEGRHRE